MAMGKKWIAVAVDDDVHKALSAQADTSDLTLAQYVRRLFEKATKPRTKK